MMRDGLKGLERSARREPAQGWQTRLVAQMASAAECCADHSPNAAPKPCIEEHHAETERGTQGQHRHQRPASTTSCAPSRRSRRPTTTASARSSDAGGDVVTIERLQRIDGAIDDTSAPLDEIVLKSQRPQLGGGESASGIALQHKAAFEGYVRHGEAHACAASKRRRCRSAPAADGGYTVPVEIEAGCQPRGAHDLADPRHRRHPPGLGQRLQASRSRPPVRHRLGRRDGGAAGDRLRRRSPNLAFPTMELYAMPSATQALLDDSAVNIDQWIADEVRVAFAEQEGTAFVTGDGVNKPKGFLDYTKVANASWTWGSIGYLATGVAGAFPAAARPTS